MKRSEGRVRRFLRQSVVVPLALLWVLPVAGVLLLLPRADGAEIAGASVQPPAVVAVGEVTEARRSAVRVEVRREEPRSLVSRRGGVVTATYSEPGDVLENGSSVVALDGRTLVALVGGTPMFRGVGPGTQGEDVRAVGTVLAARGLLGEGDVSDRYTRALGDAICAFEKSSARTCDRVFEADASLFVATPGTRVGELRVALGDVVDPGVPVLALAAAVESVTLVAESTSGRLSIPEGRPVDLIAPDGASMLLPEVPVDVEHAAEVAEFVAAHARSVQGEGGLATYDGITVALAEAETFGTVPISAVHVALSGATCVFVVEDARHVATSVDGVRAMPGLSGAVTVPAALAGVSVVRAPSRTLSTEELSTCG